MSRTLFAALVTSVAANYVVNTIYSGASCGTQIATKSTYSDVSACGPTSTVYAACPTAGGNISYFNCSSSTMTNSAIVPSGSCQPYFAGTSSRYSCITDAALTATSYSPKIQVYFGGSCTANPTVVYTAPVAGQCIQQDQSDNYYIKFSYSSSSNAIVTFPNCTTSACDVCGKPFLIYIGQCLNSPTFNEVFNFPSSAVYLASYHIGAAPSMAASLSLIVLGIAVGTILI